MTEIVRTAEQEEICRSNAKRMKIDAFAGCAKSTTIAEYTKDRRNSIFLMLAYNTTTKESSTQRFGRNTQVMTFNGLAYARGGKAYERKLIGNLKPFHLECEDRIIAARAINVINRFLHSTAEKIGADHDEDNAGGPVIDLARKTWESMKLTSGGVPMTHDGYMKLFQLSKPVIDVDRILYDEGQDANPVALDILNRQRAAITIVGDRHQSIYAYRGAVNAMQQFEADASFLLRTSFRFGRGIADLATKILRNQCGEQNALVGAGKHEATWSFPLTAPHTIICRANATVFDEAATLHANKRDFGFVGGADGYRFALICDAFKLFSGARREIRDPFLAQFTDWSEMKAYAETLDDRELGILIRVTEKYGRDTLKLASEFQAKRDHQGEVMLTTAHKSKGLEWENVRLANDFADLSDPNPMRPVGIQESNLIYVAVTRAMKSLIINPTLSCWLNGLSTRPAITTRRGVSRPIA